MAKPTEKQIAFLRKSGIKPATTKGACSKQISYILRGNGMLGKDPGERVAILRSVQDRFLNKRIVRPFAQEPFERTGTVVAVWPRSLEELLEDKRCNLPEKHPFKCILKFDDGKTMANISLGGVRLVDVKEL